jgi:hypothetical protein
MFPPTMSKIGENWQPDDCSTKWKMEHRNGPRSLYNGVFTDGGSMRVLMLVSVVVVVGAAGTAQDAAPPPQQSARQALIEMFMGKGGDDFTKHLPDEARKALIRRGETAETSSVLRIAAIGRELTAQGGPIETFDTGPNILISEDPNHVQKIEVGVERDSLAGDEDEIELSVHLYQDGRPQSLPVVPSLVFRLTQENETWKLAEVTVTAHIPLTDPDYLNGLREEQDKSTEQAAQSRMVAIAQAETTYAANHGDVGYSCTLANLFPPSAGGESGDSVPGLNNEERGGYSFSLSGCDGAPASKYRLMAVPADPESTMKVFCADESGTVKFAAVDNKASCFSDGKTASEGATPVPVVE